MTEMKAIDVTQNMISDKDIDIEDRGDINNDEEDDNVAVDGLDCTKLNPQIIFFPLSVAFVMITGIILITMTLLRSNVENNDELRFWMNQLAKYCSIGIFQYIAGISVVKYNVKVNYTRKFVHMCYFLFPLILDKYILGFEQDVYTAIWTVWVVLLLLLFMADFFVKRYEIFKILYSAIDRPEDRPNTTLWFVSQLIVSIIIIALYSYIFSAVLESDESDEHGHNRSNWIFIVVFIIALGDGLAEPVGVKFGKHKYTTGALCSKEKYTRSFEGSMCVYAMSLISIASYHDDFSRYEFIIAMIILPIIMTIVEAVSPHTWDNPILFLVGYTTLLIIYLCVNEV